VSGRAIALAAVLKLSAGTAWGRCAAAGRWSAGLFSGCRTPGPRPDTATGGRARRSLAVTYSFYDSAFRA